MLLKNTTISCTCSEYPTDHSRVTDQTAVVFRVSHGYWPMFVRPWPITRGGAKTKRPLFSPSGARETHSNRRPGSRTIDVTRSYNAHNRCRGVGEGAVHRNIDKNETVTVISYHQSPQKF